MMIRIQDATNRNALGVLLRDTIFGSRFTATLEDVGKDKIKIANIRLDRAKDYCGNHPGECQLIRDHRKGKWLEGADWVEFNDMLNDLLDRFNVAAHVASSVVVLRQGRERCTEYWMKPGFGPNAEWAKYGRYADHCGKKAPVSKFPEGTPGIYSSIGYNIEG